MTMSKQSNPLDGWVSEINPNDKSTQTIESMCDYSKLWANDKLIRIQPGSTIDHRWKIKQILGAGGFGVTFEAEDLQNIGKHVALKVETKSARKGRLQLEVAVLRSLQGCAHFCQLLGFGVTSELNYVAMTVCGRNLSEVRRETNQKRFGVSTTLKFVLQMLQSIEALHKAGWLHRDIKPSNFAIGLPPNGQNTLYLLDFGLAKRCIHRNDRIKQFRSTAAVSFKGTLRYASVRAHLHQEVGPVDDLWSLLYIIIEMATGHLPWTCHSGQNEILALKRSISLQFLCAVFPEEILIFGQHLATLNAVDEPNYEFLASLLRTAIIISSVT